MSTSDALTIVKEYIHKLKENNIPVEQAYFFGSYAQGNPTIHSDIDVCVVSPIFGKDRIDENVMLMKYRYEVSDLIEPHAYSPEDFNDPYNHIAVQVKKTGIQII